MESAIQQQLRAEASGDALAKKGEALHTTTDKLAGLNAELERLKTAPLSSEQRESARRGVLADLAETEAENATAYAEWLQAGEASAADGIEAERLRQSVLEQNPSDGEKRMAEERARADSPAAKHREQRDSVTSNHLAGGEVRRAQRNYSAYVAKNAATVGEKHLALSAVASQAKVDQVSRATANAEMQKRQDQLSDRAEKTKNGPVARGGPGPLTSAEKRELSQLKRDEARRAQENARLDRSAKVSADRRDGHARAHGKAIVGNLKATAKKLEKESRRVAEKIANLPKDDPRRKELEEVQDALWGASAAANAAADALAHFLKTGTWPPSSPVPGGVPAEPVPPGCPPDFRERCCKKCGPRETCVCSGSDADGGAGGGGGAKTAEDPGTGTGHPGVNVDLRPEGARAPPVPDAPNRYASPSSPYPRGYVPYVPCEGGSTRRSCTGCRNARQHIAILERRCGRDDRMAAECMLEAIHARGPEFGEVERFFVRMGLGAEFRSRQLGYVGRENLLLIRGALEAACTARIGPPTIEDMDPTDWGSGGGGAFLRGMLGMIGALQRTLETLVGDAIVALLEFTLDVLKKALPDELYDQLVKWMTTQLEPLLLLGKAAAELERAALEFFKSKLGLDDDEAKGLLTLLLAMSAAGAKFVTRVVSRLRDSRRTPDGLSDPSRTVESPRGTDGLEAERPKPESQPIQPDGREGGGVQPRTPPPDGRPVATPQDSPGSPTVERSPSHEPVAPADGSRTPESAQAPSGGPPKGEVEGGRKRTGGRTVQTGGRTTELKHNDWAGAEREYDVIRQTDDVGTVARNTGWKEKDIGTVKEHVFERSHVLDERVGRFDADPEIANAWYRLQQGKQTPGDMQLLEHELFEARFEKIFGVDYRTAHDAALRSGRPGLK